MPKIFQPKKILQHLHSFSSLRRLARWLLKGRTLSQKFYTGRICFDAVEHSWAWTGNTRYESYDSFLQLRLIDESKKNKYFIDLGANVGVMSLAALLNNPNILVTAVDPNARACELLRKSLSLNHLEQRTHVIQAVAALQAGEVNFTSSGSVTGHVSSAGEICNSIDLIALLNENLKKGDCLVKFDVEGYETILLPGLTAIARDHQLTLFIEVHPKGFNGYGDPEACLKCLIDLGARVEDLEGGSVTWAAPEALTYFKVSFPMA